MTEKLFDDGKLYEFDAKVMSCTEVKKGYEVVLDRSAFFPEGGGQAADEGTVNGIKVLDVQEKNGEVIHKLAGKLEVGEKVHGVVDGKVRLRRMQNHSGEHILSGLIHARFGYNNVGFHMGSSEITLDLDGPLTAEDLASCELAANEAVAADVPITISYPDAETLKTLDYRSKLDMIDNVRIVTIQGYDVCACCAPHVSSSGQIGIIKVLGFESYKGGTRVHMLCGLDALEDYNKKLNSVTAISQALSAKQDKITDAVKKLFDENGALKKKCADFQREHVAKIIADMKAEHEGQNCENLCVFTQNIDSNGMREIANAGAEIADVLFGVFGGNDDDGYSYIMSSKTVKLREKARDINSTLNGKGGGSDTMIQGSVKSKAEDIKGFFGSFKG